MEQGYLWHPEVFPRSTVAPILSLIVLRGMFVSSG